MNFRLFNIQSRTKEAVQCEKEKTSCVNRMQDRFLRKKS